MTKTDKAKLEYEEYKRKCHENDMAGGKTLFARAKDGWEVAAENEAKCKEIERIARLMYAIIATGNYD